MAPKNPPTKTMGSTTAWSFLLLMTGGCGSTIFLGEAGGSVAL